MELYEQIRREYEHGIGTIKGVAKKLGVHRRMVREALANAVPPVRKTPERARPKTEPVQEFVDGILEADKKAPRKQRHTAKRIYQRLKQEHPEMEVAESTVRQLVRSRKAAKGMVRREVFIAQSYEWGQEGQVDWYEAWADLEGERQKVQVFCLRSMASGGAFHRVYRHASQQAFLEAHELAFAYFGGVFKLLRYDNLTAAVKKILRGYRREETERFIAFRSHWGYQSEFCNPDSGNEKGGVEDENGYFRRNHLVPLPAANELEQLNEQVLGSCRAEEQRTLTGRAQTIGTAMNLEREYLLPLAKEGFDLARVSFPEMNQKGCAKVLTNYYSAPVEVGRKVTAKVYAAYVELWHEGKCVARHERCFGRYQMVLELDHYLEEMMRKPGALAGSTALEQWRRQGKWPESFDRYGELLKQRLGRAAGTRAMIELLLLGKQHGYGKLRKALERALETGCADVSTVRYLLHDEQLSRPVAEPVDIGELNRYERPQPSLECYDLLLLEQVTVAEVVQ